MAAKVRVTPGKCQGHARCFAIAPAIFDLDDEGYIAFAQKTVAPEDEKLARRAANACPERALQFEEA